MTRIPHTLLVASGSLALIAGCGSGQKPDHPATTSSAAKPGTASLYGTYERDVTKADIERTDKVRSEAGPHQERPKPAHAVLTIAEGDPQSTLTVRGSDGFSVAMDVTPTPRGALDLSTYVNPNQGAFCGPDIPMPANYTWRLRGRTLVLRPKNDPCADRDSTLTGTWKRR